MLDKPVVITFHTVLPNPKSSLFANVGAIARCYGTIIVMTGTSADILARDYDIDPQKIVVVPHGAHLIPSVTKTKLKHKYDLTGRKVLSTFGLLGPGKRVETTLKALPSIVKEIPNVMFLILGRTHPGLVAEAGESYRSSLEITVKTLNLVYINIFLKRIPKFKLLSNFIFYLLPLP